uniref:Uncharacterized protein n=1 Tax=Siphoviridae sp. ctKwY15 TaxID=2827843 RepID=A0A8S5SUF4_9CAUD|nr:MAG TPA: hypothetical protein [Siphoviridae sp. ctKwY15]
MVTLHFELELADNGVIVRNTDDKTLSVYQEQKSDKGDANRYVDRALYDEVFAVIRDLILFGTAENQPKDKYKLKIEIR